MNWQHFRAFLWLRWRLRVNQLKRGGVVNVVILALLAAGAAFFAVILFVGCFLGGLFAMRGAPSDVVLYVWDGLVVVFLFFWAIGLLADLQRSEALSLDKFLHLPVSLTSAFLINYLSSLFSVILLLSVSAMVGFSLGLIFAKGPALLLQVPLLAAFLLMVTAVTYQFQGWLASLMVNKRRRRTVIVAVTAAFILICQLPNLINLLQPWSKTPQNDLAAYQSQEQAELLQSFAKAEITPDQYKERHEAILRKYRERAQETERQGEQRVERTAKFINLVLPPGWLPLGATAAAEGAVLPALLATLGMTLLGTGSLWRAYRTTLRLYTGQFSSGKKRSPAPPKAGKPVKAAANLLEKKLPWVSEQAAAIALSGLQSLLRAPEVKMLLLAPIIMVVVLGFLIFRHATAIPDAVRPLLAFGMLATTLLTMVQLASNQFGFDRNGFRVFVLCAAARDDILLGKNLALAPLALGAGLVLVAVFQVVCPMRFDHFLAVLPQSLSMYLVYCLLMNVLSTLAPAHLPAASLKPTGFKGLVLLLHLAFVFLFPLALAPLLLPLGIEFALAELGGVRWAPIALVLSLAECVAIVYLYRLLLTWQGALLQAREQKILEIVTARAE